MCGKSNCEHKDTGFTADMYTVRHITPELFRVKLDGTGEKEIICTINKYDDDYEPDIYSIKPYGRYVLFELSYNFFEYLGEDEDTGEIFYNYDTKGAVAAYDTEDPDGIMKICDGEIYAFTVSGNKFYYTDASGDIYVKNLEDGTVNLIYDLNTDDVYSTDMTPTIFIKDGYIVYQLEDTDNYIYDEDTGTDECATYQIILNEDGTEEKTLNPYDKKYTPYGRDTI